jgi:hypothetical protein
VNLGSSLIPCEALLKNGGPIQYLLFELTSYAQVPGLGSVMKTRRRIFGHVREIVFKGTVQRKLTWVKSGINRKLRAWAWAAWGSFYILKGLGP